MKKILAIITITLGLFSLLATSQQAVAAGANAYVLIESTSNDLSALRAKVGSAGLSNCKQLVKPLFRNDLIVWIACNEVKDISPAITDLTRGIEEIKSWSIWIISSD